MAHYECMMIFILNVRRKKKFVKYFLHLVSIRPTSPKLCHDFNLI